MCGGGGGVEEGESNPFGHCCHIFFLIPRKCVTCQNVVSVADIKLNKRKRERELVEICNWQTLKSGNELPVFEIYSFLIVYCAAL